MAKMVKCQKNNTVAATVVIATGRWLDNCCDIITMVAY